MKRLTITAIVSLLLAMPASADRGLMPLGELTKRADQIVIAIVTEVVESKPPGNFAMTLRVEEVLKGSAQTPPVVITGSHADEDAAHLMTIGSKWLLFLANGKPIAGEQSTIQLNQASAPVARSIVQTSLKLGDSLRLADVAVGLTPFVPPVLEGSLHEELTLRVDKKESPLLTQIVCDAQNAFSRATQVWAIGHAGKLKVSEARLCLEDSMKRGTREKQIAAAEALGNLGAAASVPVLLRVIQPIPFQRIELPRGNEASPGFGVGPLRDPEDDAARPPDDSEERNAPANDPESRPDTVMTTDPGREPDGAASDDSASRSSDGGLADAAVLALGKIGDESAISDLFRLAREGDDLSLHSSVVVALGMIGGNRAHGPLTSISNTHPNPLVRDLAKQTLDRLQKKNR